EAPDEAAFLGEHREDEIRMPRREESEPALCSLLEALAEEAPGPDRNLRLDGLVSQVMWVHLGVENRLNASPLVVLEHHPAGRGCYRDRQHAGHDVLPLQPGDERNREEDGQIGYGGAEVALKHDQDHRDKYDGGARQKLLQIEMLALDLGVVLRERHDRDDLDQLRGLDSDAADVEPALRAMDR